MQISLQNALASYLRGGDHSPNRPSPEREESRRRLRHALGDNIYIGRVPRGSAKRQTIAANRVSALAMALMETGGEVDYFLLGEHNIQHSQMRLAIHARGGPAGRSAHTIWEYLRLAISNYVGQWSFADDAGQQQLVEIHGCTLMRPVGQVIYPSDGSDEWNYILRGFADISFKQMVNSYVDN